MCIFPVIEEVFMTEKKRGPGRPPNSKNKLSSKKLAQKAQEDLEELLQESITDENVAKLLKSGIGHSLNFLLRTVLGDKSIGGLTATNRKSAAKDLLDLGIKVMGEDYLKKLLLDKQFNEEGDSPVEKQEDPSEKTEDVENVFAFKRFQE